MRYQDFSDQLTEIAPLLGWRLDARAIQSLWRRLPSELDDACLMDAVNDAVESQARVPAMLMEFYKQRRRQSVQAAELSRPQLPPASHEGRPCREFVQVCRMMRERREGRFPDLKAACQHRKGDLPHCEAASLDCRCLAEWNARPLTDEDWQLGRATEPAAAVAAGFGMATPPAAPAHERDVVWAGGE